MSQPERSPLARLVLFLLCLSITGSILAGGACLIKAQISQDMMISHPPGNDGDNCYEVDWWTSLWRQIFGIGDCHVAYAHNECCD